MTEITPDPAAREAAEAACSLASVAMAEARGLRAQVQSAVTWSSFAFLASVTALAAVGWVVWRVNGKRLPVIAFRVPDFVAGMFPEAREFD